MKTFPKFNMFKFIEVQSEYYVTVTTLILVFWLLGFPGIHWHCLQYVKVCGCVPHTISVKYLGLSVMYGVFVCGHKQGFTFGTAIVLSGFQTNAWVVLSGLWLDVH